MYLRFYNDSGLTTRCHLQLCKLLKLKHNAVMTDDSVLGIRKSGIRSAYVAQRVQATSTTTFNFNPASSASDDSDSSTNRSLD